MSVKSFVTAFKTVADTKGADQMMQKLNELNKKLIDNQYRQRDCNKVISEAQSAIRKLEKEKKEKGKLDDEEQAKLKKLNATIEENKLKLAQLRSEQASIKNVISETSKEVANNTKEWSVLKGMLAQISGNVLTKLGTKLLSIGKDIISTGEQFSATMSEVQAISGATAEELQQLEDAARLYGSTTKFSATEAADALKYMALAGWDVQTSLAALPGILDLAAASGLDLATASDMVTDYLSAFGLAAEQAAYMADVLTYAQGNSNTSAQQLGEAWRNSAANLHAAGQDMETVTSILEAMANQGLKGSEAGTALAAMMRDITDKMEDGKIKIGETSIAVADQEGNFRDLTDILVDVEKAVDGMGTAQQAAALQATFSARSIKGVNLVLNEGMDKIGGYEQALRNSQGAAADAAKTMNDNLTGDIKNMHSALDELKLKIYDGAESPLRNLVQLITRQGVPALEGIIQNLDKIIPVAIGAATAIGTMKASLAVGKVVANLAEAVETLKQKKIAAAAASKAMTAAENAETAAKTGEAAATNVATAAQTGLNIAMAANVIGAVLSLVLALTAALGSYSMIAGNSAEQTDKMTESVKKYTEALRDAEDQQKKSIADAVGEGDKLKVLQKEYDALREKAYLTRHEKERLDAVAESIAGTLGKEIGEIKNLQGAYVDLNSEINIYIDNLLKKAKQEAAENVIKEAYASMYELEAAMEDAYQKAADLEQKIKNASPMEGFWEGDQWALNVDQWALNDALYEIELLSDEYQTAEEKAEKAAESIRNIGSAADDAGKLVDAFGMVIGVATGKTVAFAKSSEELAEELEEVQKKSTSLRSEMSSLASSMNQLEQGQTLSLDTILNLIDKYPEYAGMLIEAADNADLQKRALETLFEAKKNEYIITQEAALADVEASNSVTDNLIKNTMTQVKALNLLVQMKGIAGQAAASIASSTSQELLGLIGELGVGMSKANELRGKIEIAQKLTPGNYSTSSKSSGISSGSGASSSSVDKQKYTTDASGVHAEGDTYIRMYTTWIDRMMNLGKLTTQQEITLLEKLLKSETLTGEERYELTYKLYKAREELAKDEEKKQEERLKRQEEAAKKQQERLLERQKLAKAAFDKLVNDRISAYEAEADAAKQSADAQIKAIDDVEAKRKRTQEREKREKELAVINAKLTYEHGMTSSQRYDLERRRQEILNEQYEANHQRAVEIRKANIQSRSDAVQSRTQQAIDGLNAAKSSLADRVAYLSGSQTYDQRVANNSKTVNIQLITNGLTEDQAANRIVQKVLKELG